MAEEVRGQFWIWVGVALITFGVVVAEFLLIVGMVGDGKH